MDRWEFQIEMGRKIRKRRKELGMSLMKVSDICTIHYSHISMLENGRYDPKLTTLMKIADALECDFRTFLN